MKPVKFNDFINQNKEKSYSDTLRESLLNEQVMEINDFSDGLSEFYDFVEKYAKNMNKDTVKHIKEAIKHLDKAWENEADAHGVDFEPYRIKI